jgi:hypothetical protein
VWHHGLMASQGYWDWVAAGKPFTLAAPAKRLRNILRGYGYTVYDIGNTRHQLAEPPEDHMPYSATGWPNPSPRWYGFALDIMPPEDDNLPTLPQLLGQVYADKMARHPGVAWLKYMNWEPSGPSGPCYHDKWQPGHVRTSSGDRGHGHLSGRSDHYLTDTTGGYDPVARFRNREDDDMTPGQAWVQHVMNYRTEAMFSLREVNTVPPQTINGQVFKGFSEPCVHAVTMRALRNPDVDESLLAGFLEPMLRDIMADLDDETESPDGATPEEVRAAIADALNRAQIVVAAPSL